MLWQTSRFILHAIPDLAGNFVNWNFGMLSSSEKRSLIRTILYLVKEYTSVALEVGFQKVQCIRVPSGVIYRIPEIYNDFGILSTHFAHPDIHRLPQLGYLMPEKH